MNRPSLLFLGALATAILALIGLVLVPNWNMRQLSATPVALSDGSYVLYPQSYDKDLEAPGREAYRAQGCIYCHSQQVRAASFGADIDRGWGERRSVPRDYALQKPPLMGTMRTGPDLANIGVRQPSDAWHHLHLYDARLTSPGSTMPPFGFLYEVVQRDPGRRGYPLPNRKAPTWIVPSMEATQIVAYLKALHQAHPVDEVR